MSTYNNIGIVLNSEPFREVDRLVTIYTKNFGKLKLLVKGGLRIESKLAGHLEPICLTEISWVKGKYFNHITRASAESLFYKIKNDFNKVSYSLSATKILDQLILPEKADFFIYQLLIDFLQSINNEQELFKMKILWNVFCWQLIKSLGLGPNLEVCLECNKTVKEKDSLLFDFQGGGVVHRKCVKNNKGKIKISSNEIKLIRLFLKRPNLIVYDWAFWKNKTIKKKLLDKTENILKKFLIYHEYSSDSREKFISFVEPLTTDFRF